MKDDDILLSKKIDTSDLTNIKLSNKDIKILEKAILELRKCDPVADISLKKIGLNEEEYINSLGDIYYYLLDRKICLNCKKNIIDDCPKKNKGICKFLQYDEDFHVLKLNSTFCSCYKKMSNAFNNNLIYTSLTNDDINSFNLEFKRKIFNKDLFLTAIISKINKLLSEYKKDELNKGLIFYKLDNSKQLYSAAIKMAIYKYSLKTSYFDFKDDLFSKLNSKYENESSSSLKIYNEAIKSQILFIDNFDVKPKYFFDFTSAYLIDILKIRNSKSYLTFINFSIFSSVKSFLNSLKKYLTDNKIKELEQLINELAVAIIIKN